MKKFITYFTLLIVSLLALASCDNNTGGEDKPPVENVPATSIRIILPSDHDSYLTLDESFELEILVSPDNATVKDYTLTSSDTNVLAIDGNTITAKEVGKSTVTATVKDSDVSSSIVFTVGRESEPNYVETTIADLNKKTEADTTTLYRVSGTLTQDHMFDGKENKYGMAYLVDKDGNAIRVFRSSLFDQIITEEDGTYSYDRNHAYGEEAFAKIPYGSTVTMDVLVDMHTVDGKPMIAGYYVSYSNCSDCDKEFPVNVLPAENGTVEVESNNYGKVGVISCTPAEGYKVGSVEITYVDGTTVEGRLDHDTENTYHFSVNGYQTIKVTFVVAE